MADLPVKEGGELVEDIKNVHKSRVEKRQEEYLAEEEQSACQSRRPLSVRKLSNRYDEWILNS